MHPILPLDQPIDAARVRDILQQRLPGDCRVKVLPLNRRRVQVRRGFFVLCEVQTRKDSPKIDNPWAAMLGLSVFVCLPMGLYMLFKRPAYEELSRLVREALLEALAPAGQIRA